MLKSLFSAIIGDRNERETKKLLPVVDEINTHFERLKVMPLDELRAQTDRFRATIQERTAELRAEVETLKVERHETRDREDRVRLAEQISKLEEEEAKIIEQTLDELLPEAFATVKAAATVLLGSRFQVTGREMTWDMVHYDVQLVGGIVLHSGKVAEMATGEGKTLVATLPMYLNALSGRGVHLVTVNSYLAQRDSEWMGHLFTSLGLTVGCIDLHEPGTPERRAAYAADITYGTNNEFGFDYLRDNMVHSLDMRVQRGHNYAIVDEVDSVLVDEARTPLIISGPVGDEEDTAYSQMVPAVSGLVRQQMRLVNELLAEAERDIAAGNQDDAGRKLLAVSRGAPKNRKLQKLMADDPGLKKLILKVEGDFMREKNLAEVDEQLYFAMDEKGHSVHLSDRGLTELSPNDPEAFTVPDIAEMVGRIERDPSLDAEVKRQQKLALESEFASKSQRIHVIHQLLKAYALYEKDVEYVLQDNEVFIVDEFTGRLMPGRRWSDGLHQAVEAKEGVRVQGETQTLATITIQNYFRMFRKLAGMTGTAITEETEFHKIYQLEVQVIPTNQPVVREDRNDLIFRTKREKYNAIADEAARLNELQIPILVGTTSVDVSETISRLLKRRGVPHNVLNAKYHQREAEIVAGAGQPGAVTIATNMAGRGTDIKLGAGVTAPRSLADDKIELGGLHIIGSERHESRRIDRQLRGRSGRQGDPGVSQFFLSLEDDLMRLFGSERIAAYMERAGAEEGEVISHPLVTRSIESAQKRVETNNFEARKRLLDYDDVMNQQREVIYDLRLFALEGGDDLRDEVLEAIEVSVESLVEEYAASTLDSTSWDLAGLGQRFVIDFGMYVQELMRETGFDGVNTTPGLTQALVDRAQQLFESKVELLGEERGRFLSWVMLAVIDDKWKEHLYDLDHLKSAIHYRGWGQKDPLVEYKDEAYKLFVDLMTDIKKSVTQLFFRTQVVNDAIAPKQTPMILSGPSGMEGVGDLAQSASPRASSVDAFGGQSREDRDTVVRTPVVSSEPRVGRNDPCPCGSGKKYKHCHGRDG